MSVTPDPAIPAGLTADVRPAPLTCGIAALCPRCGAKTLFASLAGFAPACRACGLDYAGFNVGDGPAAFLTLGIGAIVVALAITLELTMHPPFWVHILLWLPFTLIGVIGSLRVAKGMLLALEYRNAAREGRIDASVAASIAPPPPGRA